MSKFGIAKVVASLPGTLTPDTLYLVRTGVGFDLYCSDTTGAAAHQINSYGEGFDVANDYADVLLFDLTPVTMGDPIPNSPGRTYNGEETMYGLMGTPGATYGNLYTLNNEDGTWSLTREPADMTITAFVVVSSPVSEIGPEDRQVIAVKRQGATRSLAFRVPGDPLLRTSGATNGYRRITDGAVVTVNGHTKDGNGNVVVTPADVGLGVVTATGATAAAARTAIGAGTGNGSSNLTIGTTSSTAKAGDYAPAWTDITGKPAVIGAGADAAAARTAIGAGTSSLAIGTTSTTAKAGDYYPFVGSQLLSAAFSNNNNTGFFSGVVTLGDPVPGTSGLTYTVGMMALNAGYGGAGLGIYTLQADGSWLATNPFNTDGYRIVIIPAGRYTNSEFNSFTGTMIFRRYNGGSKEQVFYAAEPAIKISSASNGYLGVPATIGDMSTVPTTSKLVAGALAEMYALIGAPSWASITGKPAVIAAGADAATARAAIGAGTSSLTIGTTSTTAKAGDYAPSWSDVTGKPAVIAAGADAATARAAIGAGTGNGSSNLALGTTSSTAKAGDYTPSQAELRNGRTALTISSGVVNIDCSLGNYFTLALNANVTSITFSNVPSGSVATTLMVRVTQDSTPRTVALPSSFRYEGSAPSPTVSAGSGAVDVWALTTFDNGTKWDATISKGRV